MSDELRTTALAGRVSAVGARVDYPVTPDIAAVVRAVIESDPARRPDAPTRTRRRWLAVAVAAVVLTPTAVLATSPAARDAVARWLGIRGVVIERQPSAAPLPTALGLGFKLGEAVSLPAAQDRTSFRIGLPTLLGAPDEVYVAAEPAERVSLVYRARADLPAAPFTSAGAVLTELRAGVRPELLKKLLGGGTTVEPVMVGGSPGYYISGAPHVVMLLSPTGEPIEDTVALAGDIVLWERDGVTYRLESILPKADALRIAGSVR